MRFVNLHHHSTFSFGDGFGTPAQHVARAAELGYSAVALTEHGNVSSHFQLEKAAKKAGIKPIFGLEAYTGHTDDRRSQWKWHLTILAENLEGYRSLNRVVSQSYRDFHYHATANGETLAQNATGLIVLSGCAGSLLAATLVGGKGTPEHLDIPDMLGAQDVIDRFVETFGDRYFLEVQPFGELPRICAMNACYERLSKITSVPMVVTHDVHYPRMEDSEMQAVLHAVHRGKHSVDDVMREWNYSVPLTLPSSDSELQSRLEGTGLSRRAAQAAIATSAEIAEMCNVTLPRAERLRYPISEEDLVPWTGT